MNVEIEALHGDSSTATLRLSPAMQGQADSAAIAKVAALAKMELGLPRAAKLGIQIQGSAVHVEMLKGVRSHVSSPRLSAQHTLPNVTVTDVFTKAPFTLFETMPAKAPKTVLVLLDGTTKATTMQALQAQAIDLQAKRRDVHFIVLHDAPSPEQVADKVALKKWFFPQQTLHHYHIAGDALATLKKALSISATPYHVLADASHRVLAHGPSFSFELLQPAAMPAVPSTTLYVPQDACHGMVFPNVDVVILPAPNARYARSLFELLVPTKYTILDFWSTTCPKSPAAMEALVAHHAKHSGDLPLQYVLINTDDPVKAWDRVQAHYKNTAILNVYLAPSEKATLDKFLGLQQSSHCVLLHPARHVIRNGSFFSYDIVDMMVQPVPPTPPSSPTAYLPGHDACHGKVIPDVPVLRLGTQIELSLHAVLTRNALVVLDFWSTTCVKCPEAIATLLAHHAEHAPMGRIQYILVNTDNATKGWSMVQTRQWHHDPRVLHLHVSPTAKTALQVFLGMKQVPHHVYLGPDHAVRLNGSFFSYAALDAQVPASPTVYVGHDACHGKAFPKILATDMRTMMPADFTSLLPRGRTATILDFWSTTCVQCPEAIATLLAQAAANTDKTVQYVLVNADDAKHGWAMVLRNGWATLPNVTHVHVTLPAKEALKRFLGMKQFPHHVALDAANMVVANGKFFSYAGGTGVAKPRTVSVAATLSLAAATLSPVAATSTPAFVLDDDF
ncbi:hypothetical protein SDRG_04506 [Saprolegnia diclina VS20]|uniref:Thioredoxin domain-containing protein n=1 Tax=Saprolegnia diclina (strain VS20) TaxID=1156394 RepID=T0QTP6_SAPDV|nr:hypothetical protein SDRG_04506 [Saprolegnia diclina VS20]EQC38076.1 hypothetical protein SDRG_04506 [Saprolegnia diclina VS20]|eukprot:XP_008608403.1 hypothetical protein SDRG_04506 [Saprolegnia diclina VS20]